MNLTHNDDNNNIIEIQELKKIVNSFQGTSTLGVNFEKTVVFSSIDNKALDTMQQTYDIKNVSKEEIRILGHIIKPIDHFNSKLIIKKIWQNITLAVSGLKKVQVQGRYLLKNTFLSSQVTYHCPQLKIVYKKWDFKFIL